MFPNFSLINRRENLFVLENNFENKFVIKKLLLLKLKPNYKNFRTNFVPTLR